MSDFMRESNYETRAVRLLVAIYNKARQWKGFSFYGYRGRRSTSRRTSDLFQWGRSFAASNRRDEAV